MNFKATAYVRKESHKKFSDRRRIITAFNFMDRTSAKNWAESVLDYQIKTTMLTPQEVGACVE